MILNAQGGKDAAQRLFDSTKVHLRSQAYTQVTIQFKKYYNREAAPTFDYTETIVNINNDLMKRTTIFFRNSEKICRDGSRMVVVEVDRKAYFNFKFSRKEGSEFVDWEDNLQSNTFYMASCFAPWMNSFKGRIFNTPNLLSVSDTSVAGRHYRIIHGQSTYPGCYRLTYFVNPSTYIIERMEMALSDSTKSGFMPSKTEIEYTVSYEDRSREMQDLFSPGNPAYADYEFGDDASVKVCSTPLETGDTLPDAALDFPLLCMDGTTTTLRQLSGYILLDFFNNHCHPCIKFMREQKAERDSLGTTRLEKNGIQVVSINTMSRSVEYTRSVLGEALDEKHTLLGFGIREHIKIDAYPTFILVSPDKKVLLITYRNRPNYIESIINAKND